LSLCALPCIFTWAIDVLEVWGQRVIFVVRRVNVGVGFEEVIVDVGVEMEVDVDGDAEKGWDV
jgi:hypothetical protein